MSLVRVSALGMIVLVGFIGTAAVRDLHAAAVGEGQPGQEPSASAEQPEPAALSLIRTRCTACHGVDQVFLQRKNEEDWRDTIQRMIDRGTDVTEEEQEVITQYLIENYAG
jgi:cytochrome c5